MIIDFHKTFHSPSQTSHINTASRNINSLFRGFFHKECTRNIVEIYNNSPCYLTSSCTEALLMSIMILDLKVGDEVILSSFTFVSVANVLINRGCIVRFADCNPSSPSLNFESVKSLVNSNTKAIIDMYYGGLLVEEHKTLRVWSRQKGIWHIADVAHGFLSHNDEKPLGLEADIAVFSFHETKVIQSGQGGFLLLNIPEKEELAIQIYNHGKDRHNFKFSNKIFYQWLSEGYEFNLNELSCAVLWSQLEFSNEIIKRLKGLLKLYIDKLQSLSHTIILPKYNFKQKGYLSIMYLITNSKTECNTLKQFLLQKGIDTRTHYYPLHLSKFYQEYSLSDDKYNNTNNLASSLLRLPLHNSLTEK